MQIIKTVSLITVILCVFCCNTRASERLVLRYEAPDNEIKSLMRWDEKIKEVYGEITAVSPEKITLESNGENHLYKLMPQVKIYCNGLPSLVEAIKPIGKGAYFEGAVLVNEFDEVILINAFYYGEPVVINSWIQKDGKVILSVYVPNSNETRDYLLANNCRIPGNPDWLAEEQEIFVLYNINHEIRAVFLPNSEF